MMPNWKRFFWILSMASFLVMTSGCASSHWREIEDEIQRDGTGLHEASGQKIDGFQLEGEDPTEYKGWARIVDGDSLSLWTEEAYRVGRGPGFSLAVVDRLDFVQSSTGKTVFRGVGLVALVVGVAVASYMNSDLEFTANE